MFIEFMKPTEHLGSKNNNKNFIFDIRIIGNVIFRYHFSTLYLETIFVRKTIST